MYEIVFRKDDLTQIDRINLRLSIQLKQDGLSFCVTNADEQKLCVAQMDYDNLKSNAVKFLEEFNWSREEFSVIEIINVTDKFMLIPSDIYNMSDRNKYLDTDNVCERRFLCGIVLLTEDREQPLREMGFGKSVHPFEQIINREHSGKNTIYISSYSSVSFIVLYVGGELKYADSIPVSDFESLLFAVRRLLVEQRLGRIQILCNDKNLQQQFAYVFADVKSLD